MIKLRMLDALSSDSHFYKTKVSESDLKTAMGILNDEKHKEYLSKVLGPSTSVFVMDENAKDSLNLIIGDIEAPENLRKASHLLLYHGDDTQKPATLRNQESVFSFDN